MKILVYGAGNIGCIYAAKLSNAGHDTTILARGHRKTYLDEHGIELQEFGTGTKSVSKIKTTDRLNSQDTYDLVLVVLPKQSVADVLPILATNQKIPNVLFFGNNAAGYETMTAALGRKRVMLGFPGAAGTKHGNSIRYLIMSAREQPTTIGEIDGSKSTRILEFREVFKSAGFPVSVSNNIDAWLKTHVAEIVPTANAFYMAGTNIEELKRNREVIRLMLRAIREGYRVLLALGIPITPSSHRVFRWIPEFLLVPIMKSKLNDETMNIKIGHAKAARDEMKVISDDFHELVRQSAIDTPAIDQLRNYLD